jgi:hypothetical protein
MGLFRVGPSTLGTSCIGLWGPAAAFPQFLWGEIPRPKIQKDGQEGQVDVQEWASTYAFKVAGATKTNV